MLLRVLGLRLLVRHLRLGVLIANNPSEHLLAIRMLVDVRRVAHQGGTPAARRQCETALVAAVHAAGTGGRNGYGHCTAVTAAHHLLRLLAAVGHYSADRGRAGSASESRLLRMLMSDLPVGVHVQGVPGVGGRGRELGGRIVLQRGAIEILCVD